MSDIQELTDKVMQFRRERDWEQFHNQKDEAISIALEAAELLEHFQWKTKEEVAEYLKTHQEDISDELADVVIYCLGFARNTGINLREAIERKLEKQAKKYPIEKAKGSAKKYTEFGNI